jgi:cytochrome c biogenesis protein ResB
MAVFARRSQFTLKELINERDKQYAQRFEAQEKAVAAAWDAAREARNKAEASAEKRFDSVNEFRNTLKDQQLTLMTRTEAEIRFKSLEDKVALAFDRGRTAVWGYVMGGLGLVGILITIFKFLSKE